jgi:Holliday junction resolvase-like predicted endonuclease
MRRQGFEIVDRNIARKTGEIDIIGLKAETLHFVEVKSLVCIDFPAKDSQSACLDSYDPADNLHPLKIRKVARTSEWYVANNNWEGEWQVDGALVWLRKRDGMARVQYIPQIL